MKLMCVLIVAMLFLTVCQLITADDSRDKQEYPAERWRTKMQNSKRTTSTRKCKGPLVFCPENHECCSKFCDFIDIPLRYCSTP
uniref:O-superfamily conotoxin Br7.9 n=1 Tax=Conus brunneus TaxID=101289 RepID=M1F3K8_CONBR|nr:O-superfamily conotoxin Br7.9 precursor [Conus brunneus]